MKKIFFVLVMILTVVLCASNMSYVSYLLPALVFGAVYTQGIMGPYKGKVGGVVGKNWKAINYISGYARPSNPNTADQQVQRSRMRSAVELGRAILGTIIQPYWDPFYNESSGWAEFIGNNIMVLDGAPDYNPNVNNIFAKGGITPSPITDASNATAVCTIEFATTLSGNQLSTDVPVGLVLKADTRNVIGVATTGSRATGSLAVTCSPNPSADDLVFLFFKRASTVEPFDVSDSDGLVIP